MRPEWFVPFLPVVGVLIGWLLNELTARLRTRGETRRRLGEAVAVLLALRQEMKTIIETCEAYKDIVGLNPVFEYMRKRAVQRQPNFQNAETSDQRLDEAVKAASGVNPVLGYRLLGIVGMFKVLKRSDLASFAGNKDAYVRGLSVMEVGQAGQVKELELLIYRLSLHMGPLTWLSVIRLCRWEKKRLGGADITIKEMLEPLLKQAAESKDGKREKEEPNPEPATVEALPANGERL